MAKFHIDPSGNPGKCRARIRCPWGDLEADHYPSERTARKAYELEYASEIHRFSAKTGALLAEIGPRQLPNRMWISLREGVLYNHWSVHEMELAAVTFGEEQEKLNGLLEKTPKEQWSSIEQEAAENLPLINESKAEILSELTAWRQRNLQAVRNEFPEDYAD